MPGASPEILRPVTASLPRARLQATMQNLSLLAGGLLQLRYCLVRPHLESGDAVPRFSGQHRTQTPNRSPQVEGECMLCMFLSAVGDPIEITNARFLTRVANSPPQYPKKHQSV